MRASTQYAHAAVTFILGCCVIALLLTPPPEPPAPQRPQPTDRLVLLNDERSGFVEIDANVPGMWLTSPRTGRVRVLTEADFRRPGQPGRPIGAVGSAE